MLDDDRLVEIAHAFLGVPGMRAVALGGSRARGTHSPDSDVDLGLYYESALGVDELPSCAREFGGARAAVPAPGGWRPGSTAEAGS